MLAHKLWASEASALAVGRPRGLYQPWQRAARVACVGCLWPISEVLSPPKPVTGSRPPSSKGSLPGPRLVWNQEREVGVSQSPFFRSTCF